MKLSNFRKCTQTWLKLGGAEPRFVIEFSGSIFTYEMASEGCKISGRDFGLLEREISNKFRSIKH